MGDDEIVDDAEKSSEEQVNADLREKWLKWVRYNEATMPQVVPTQPDKKT